MKNWDVLGDDVYGDCNAVAWANQRRLVTFKLGNQETYPTLKQVLQFYKIQYANFDSRNPEPPGEGGMQIRAGLEYLVKEGGPDGIKAVAFAAVNVTSISDVHAALAIFGCLWLGIMCSRTIVASSNRSKLGR